MSLIITNLAADAANRIPVKKEWKKFNDAAMVPDRGFTKQLKTLDPEYEVVWDSVSDKWEIWKVPKGEGQHARHILTVQTKNRTYKELSQQVLLDLSKWSWNRGFSAKEIAAYFDTMDEQVRRRKMQDFRNKIEAITLDTFDFVRGVVKIQVPQKYSIERMIKNE